MKPLFLMLTHCQAVEALIARNAISGPFKGDFSGWYYQWKKGGPIDGPYIDLGTAIAAAEREVRGREAS